MLAVALAACRSEPPPLPSTPPTHIDGVAISNDALFEAYNHVQEHEVLDH